MFHYIKGKVTMKFGGGVVVETNGIGYEVFLPDNSSIYLTNHDEEILVYTAMIIKEDDVSIYGFPEKEAIYLFRKLMTVSGVGAKAALAILSIMPVLEVKKAIVFGDTASLTRANGIGKKSAERIILELKDKLGEVGGLNNESRNAVVSDNKSEAIDALLGLGYSKSEAMTAISGITQDNLTTEEYIKQALKRI
ncbi:Holliday junction branch migration protein RuvA [Anaerovorax odorimutans]|uniref:Holliday junction branch migration protein RuvA n=1 Tax=Anaerovorax odorimutans TaxID=109327 RepID=UPI0004252FF4|nr:Holliday junction branch migration protein RuvA [Anaerovorax odorimutans]